MTTLNRKPRLQSYVDVQTRNVPTLLTGNEKIDSFASNKKGFVIGSAIFLTGTSGAGKTTFSLWLQKLFKDEKTVLYSREMEACDVKEQTERLGFVSKNVLIADKSDCANIGEFIEAIDEVKPRVVVIDSLQVLMKEDCVGGKKEQELYDLIKCLREWVSQNDAVLFVIGHVNKDGSFEGSNTIKHMFDAHMHMHFDEKTGERVLGWTKNRKGDTSTKLYYSFTENDMVFYTEDEWKSRTRTKSIIEVVDSLLEGYLKSMNRNHPFFKVFCEEFYSRLDDIDGGEEEFTSKSFLLVHELTLKYDLVSL